MFNPIHSKKKINKKIEELAVIVHNEMLDIVHSKGVVDPKALGQRWEDAQMKANRLIVELCLGGEFKKNKMRYHGNLPDHDQTAQIVELVEDIATCMFQSVSSDDIGTPIMIPAMGKIMKGPKFSKKEINETMRDKEGICHEVLTPTDVTKLLAIGHKIRKGEIIKTTVVIGTVTLLITSGAVFFLMANKKKDATDTDGTDVDDSELNEDDLNDVELDEDDLDMMDQDLPEMDNDMENP